MNNVHKTNKRCIFSYEVDGEKYYYYRLKFKKNDVSIDTIIKFDSQNKRFNDVDDLEQYALTVKKYYKSDEYQNKKYREKFVPTETNYTVEKVWESFIDSAKKSREPQTILRYNSVFKNQIQCYNYYTLNRQVGKKGEWLDFGKVNINDITVANIQDIIIDIANGSYKKNGKNCKYSYDTIYHIYKVFTMLIDYAADNKILNPEAKEHLSTLKFPKNRIIKSNVDMDSYNQIRTLTDEQIEQIKELLKGTPLYLPMLISLYAGTRPAETFAVQLSDFKIKEKNLIINKQITRENQTFYLKTLKARKSGTKAKRVIRVPDELLNEIEKEIERRKTKGETDAINKGVIVFDKITKNDYVTIKDFVAVSDNGVLCTIAGTFKKYNYKIKEKICPHEEDIEDFSFYTFRKTHLSRMAAAGMPITELMQRSGHTKIETLEKYYQNPNDAKDVIDKCLESAFGGISI